MRRVFQEINEGYHGTLQENIEVALDKQTKIYNKSLNKKARTQGLDIAVAIDQAMDYAYYNAFRRVEWDFQFPENYAKAKDLAVLLQGTRVDDDSMNVEKIFRFKYSELDFRRGIPISAILVDVTEDFFKNKPIEIEEPEFSFTSGII